MLIGKASQRRQNLTLKSGQIWGKEGDGGGYSRSGASRSRNNAWYVSGPVGKSTLTGPHGFTGPEKLLLVGKACPGSASRGVQKEGVQWRGGERAPGKGKQDVLRPRNRSPVWLFH